MPRDKSKKMAYDNEWMRKNTAFYSFRFTYKSGIPDAILKCAQDNNTTVPQTIKIAIKEKLLREGYWKEDDGSS